MAPSLIATLGPAALVIVRESSQKNRQRKKNFRIHCDVRGTLAVGKPLPNPMKTQC